MWFALLLVSVSASTLDAIPAAIGVETRGGVMTVLLGSDSLIPSRQRVMLTNTNLNSTRATVRVFMGHRAFVRHNWLACEFVLSGLHRNSLWRKNEIEVTGTCGRDGKCVVEAEEFFSGARGNCTLEYPKWGNIEGQKKLIRPSEVDHNDAAELNNLKLEDELGDLVPYGRLTIPSSCNNFFECDQTGNLEFLNYGEAPSRDEL